MFTPRQVRGDAGIHPSVAIDDSIGDAYLGTGKVVSLGQGERTLAQVFPISPVRGDENQIQSAFHASTQARATAARHKQATTNSARNVRVEYGS